jgi:predicted AAA+ superfamily ATPase
VAKLKAISEELIIKRLRLENPWWDTGIVPEEYSSLKPRLYLRHLFAQVQKPVRRALVLMGPRRVGKTVMLFQLIDSLLSIEVPKRKICYISIDAPIYNNISLEQLFEYCRKALNDDDPAGYYIIFDEIQYLKHWEEHLKSLVDFYKQTRFIVSGSAAAALKLKSNESGAGRFTEFLLPPLTFQEYLHLKDIEYLITEQAFKFKDEHFLYDNSTDIHKTNEHFIDYINFGGYPEVLFNEHIQQDPGRFIRSDIIDKVLLRDLPSLYGIRDVQELNSLFNVIAYNSGNEFNLEGLSQESGVEKNTIRRYLEYLEAAFLIRILYPVGINTKRFKRDSRFKIYLTNPSMRCALFAPIKPEEDHFGQMVETAIVAQYLHGGTMPLHFAAWAGGEVDLVMVGGDQKPIWAMEVKWSNQYISSPGKLKSLLKYSTENKLPSVFATSISGYEKRQVQTKDIYFIPAALLCYSAGKNGLRYRFNDRLFYSISREEDADGIEVHE